MSVKMRVLYVLVLCLAVCQAILVTGRSAVNTTAVHSNRQTIDQIIPQESNQRSTFYSDYYPNEHGSPEHGFDYGSPHHLYPSHHYSQPHLYHGQETALQALLLPLAGVALLGAAAVFASNPILLQLGVVSGRRRRRELRRYGISAERLQDVLMLQKFVNQLPQDEVAREERRLLASYLTYSVNHSACLERLACELFHPGSSVRPAEQRIMDIIIYEIINNEFIKEEMKINIIKARKAGHFGEHCGQFPCQQLDQQAKVKNKGETSV